MKKETLYQKICRYHSMFENRNVEFLKYLFSYYDLFKQKVGVKADEISADKLIVFAAIEDYENKKDFSEV